jgi:hypothetical protein
MSKARDMAELITTALSQASASVTYATQASLATINTDNNPDIFLGMGG